MAPCRQPLSACKEAGGPEREVGFRRHAGQRRGRGRWRRRPGGKAQGIGTVDEAEDGLQPVVAVGPAADDVEEKVELGGGGPGAVPGPGAGAAHGAARHSSMRRRSSRSLSRLTVRAGGQGVGAVVVVTVVDAPAFAEQAPGPAQGVEVEAAVGAGSAESQAGRRSRGGGVAGGLAELGGGVAGAVQAAVAAPAGHRRRWFRCGRCPAPADWRSGTLSPAGRWLQLSRPLAVLGGFVWGARCAARSGLPGEIRAGRCGRLRRFTGGAAAQPARSVPAVSGTANALKGLMSFLMTSVRASFPDFLAASRRMRRASSRRSRTTGPRPDGRRFPDRP